MEQYRFGVLVQQDAPFAELQDRWRTAEEIGVDALYVADHSRDPRDERGHWFDGWTVLAAMALATRTVRIGTLVTNPVLRPPLLTAKAAATVDHLSGGRLELGIGTGIAAFDHAAAGLPCWSPRERAERYREYVQVVDGLLRSAERSCSCEGRYYGTVDTSLVPAPVQRPRPPIIAGGQSPTVRRVAAELADGWNTHGPPGRGVDEVLEVTRQQNQELDRRCDELHRDRGTLRRSLLLFGPLDVWEQADRLRRLVDRFADVGMQEFVVLWPADSARRAAFERVLADVLRDRARPRTARQATTVGTTARAW